MIRLFHRTETGPLETATGPLMNVLNPDRERLERNLFSGPALINTPQELSGLHSDKRKFSPG